MSTGPANEEDLAGNILGAEEQARLTRCEMQVLRLSAKRMIAREIGEALFISSRTVEFHRRNICEKFHVRSIAEAVALYTQIHFQPAPDTPKPGPESAPPKVAAVTPKRKPRKQPLCRDLEECVQCRSKGTPCCVPCGSESIRRTDL